MYSICIKNLVFFIAILHFSFAIQEENGEGKNIGSVDIDNHVSQEHTKGHILIFHNAGTRSHLMALNALAEGLVEYGNRVTSIVYAESKIQNDNYREILIEDK